eukprot:6214436-Pleurochrysis_carterae.AAC.4
MQTSLGCMHADIYACVIPWLVCSVPVIHLTVADVLTACRRYSHAPHLRSLAGADQTCDRAGTRCACRLVSEITCTCTRVHVLAASRALAAQKNHARLGS